MVEIWKDIPNFEGYYQASSIGNIRSLSREVNNFIGTRKIKGKVLKKKKCNVYEYVILSKNGKYYSKSVHRLVAEAFIPNPDKLPQINHKDENPLNNCIDNLEWCTNKYNCNYGTRNKRVIENKSNKVIQYDLQGNVIKEWPSAVEVEKNLCFNQAHIRSCCRGQCKTAYNYKWKYKK